MLALIAALTIATYSPPAAEGWTYRVRLTFDGDLPLLGGQRGKAEVLLGLRAESTPASEALAARIEPQAFEIRFNGEPLPLTLDDARPYLPPTTLRYSPSGKVLSNDAPEPNIPVRIPGLHPKRLPETVLLPIELPEGAIDREHAGSTQSPSAMPRRPSRRASRAPRETSSRSASAFSRTPPFLRTRLSRSWRPRPKPQPGRPPG